MDVGAQILGVPSLEATAEPVEVRRRLGRQESAAARPPDPLRKDPRVPVPRPLRKGGREWGVLAASMFHRGLGQAEGGAEVPAQGDRDVPSLGIDGGRVYEDSEEGRRLQRQESLLSRAEQVELDEERVYLGLG